MKSDTMKQLEMLLDEYLKVIANVKSDEDKEAMRKVYIGILDDYAQEAKQWIEVL